MPEAVFVMAVAQRDSLDAIQRTQERLESLHILGARIKTHNARVDAMAHEYGLGA